MTERLANERPVSFSLFDPSAPSLFKSKRNDKAHCTLIFCEIKECPLREEGYCACGGSGPFTSFFCPYGKRKQHTGYTRRAKKYYSWIEDKKEEYGDLPRLKSPPKKLAFVGDYVYLPYPHIDMNEDVPFLYHKKPLGGGRKPFVEKDDWNLEMVKSIIGFHPQAMLGGEIKTYQKESVPSFLQHLREEAPEMFGKLIEDVPKLEDRVPDYVGRTAKLFTLNAPIEWETEGGDTGKYKVKWRWDGEKLATESVWAYNKTWGKVRRDEIEQMEMRITPTEDSILEVRNNSWVNEDTEFVD